MIQPDRPVARLLLALALLGIAGTGSSLRAQDAEEEEVRAVVVPQFIETRINIDQQIFQGVGNAAQAREKLESTLTLQVEDLDRTCGLSPVQKKKLILAGQGDIKRFFDRVDEIRSKSKQIPNNPNRFNVLWQELQPLQNAYRTGLFREESIYSKALAKTLSEDQNAKHESVLRDRMLYRYWARVELSLELLNNAVGFSVEQRRRLRKLLEEETRPPKKLGQNDYYVVLYQLSTLPETKIKPIFDDGQWGLLKRQLTQARGLFQWLKQNGFVPDDQPAGTKAESVAKQAKTQRSEGR
jgi:hypothetical protein